MSNKQFNCFPWLKTPLSHSKFLFLFKFLCLIQVGFGVNESLQKYHLFGFLVENLNKRTVFRLDKDFANDMSIIKHVETKFMQYSVVCEFLRDQRDY